MNKIPAIYQGKLNSLDEIKVSPLSRAYTFSDSIYEVIPYFDGVPLCFQMHMERLKLSLEMSGINADMVVVQNEISSFSIFNQVVHVFVVHFDLGVHAPFF